jgi:hypothetical protein
LVLVVLVLLEQEVQMVQIQEYMAHLLFQQFGLMVVVVVVEVQ